MKNSAAERGIEKWVGVCGGRGDTAVCTDMRVARRLVFPKPHFHAATFYGDGSISDGRETGCNRGIYTLGDKGLNNEQTV